MSNFKESSFRTAVVLNKEAAFVPESPIAVLIADNSNKLRQLREAAAAQNIKTNDFVETMLRENSAAQLRDTAATSENAHEYIAIALFGPGETIRELTKKFSVFRAPTSDNAAAA